MSGSLRGKLALVTGAGSGIGRATCRLFAREGAKVVAADRNLAAAEATAHDVAAAAVADVAAVHVDVASLASVAEAVTTTIAKFRQPPSVVVNCAGITRDGYLLKLSERDFDDVYSVNLKGSFLVTQQFAQAMVAHGVVGGAIVNLASVAAKLSGVGQANYAATKAGVVSLTEVACKEFGKFGIRVNAVLPGYIDTPMAAAVPAHLRQQWLARCPLGRLGRPEEVAEVIAFLASDRAAYVNGASVEVTGGLR